MASIESARAQKSVQHELPNMLLSTSYALNKSNSKRATVGLEYHGGLYVPVVKFGGGGAPAKYVTLDVSSWEMFVDQMDTISAFLNHSFTFGENFGNPIKIYLPKHDINFTQAYGARAIGIDERPAITIDKIFRAIEVETEAEPSCSKDSIGLEPPSKKKKYDNPPTIAMQLATFEGLKQVRECITHRLKYLEECAIFVNRSLDSVQIILKEKLSKEGENAKNTVKDIKAFKQFYALNKNDIEISLKNKIEFLSVSENVAQIFLHELYAYCLPLVAKDIYESMYQS